MNSQNLDKLNRLDRSLVHYMFNYHVVGWTYCYMVEVRLDTPGKHLLDGGDGLVVHGGNGSRRYAKHYGNDDWAVIHHEDEDWRALDKEGLMEEALGFFADDEDYVGEEAGSG